MALRMSVKVKSTIAQGVDLEGNTCRDRERRDTRLPSECTTGNISIELV